MYAYDSGERKLTTRLFKNSSSNRYVHEITVWILMYVPCTLRSLLFRPTNGQYINSNVYFLKYYGMFRCMYFILVTGCLTLSEDI